MAVSHNVTLIYNLLKFTPVKGVGFKASTNLAIKLSAYNKVFGLLDILALLVLF
jgi:hypothetical protein